MAPYLDHALRLIENGNPQIAGEGFLMLAEVVSVNCLQNFRSDIYPQANTERLDATALKDLQQRIQDWIVRHPDHAHVSSAFWVLGKFHDEALRPFLRHWLAYHVERIKPSLHPLGQILVALDNLGEDTISGGSFAAFEHGKNLDDAIRYLDKVDKG